METWQVTVVILVSMLTGALMPVLVMILVTAVRAYRKVTKLTTELEPTLERIKLIAARVEVISRALEGREKNLAEILEVGGQLANRVERNMGAIGIASSVMAAVVPAVSAYLRAKREAEATEEQEEGSEEAEAAEPKPNRQQAQEVSEPERASTRTRRRGASSEDDRGRAYPEDELVSSSEH